MTNENKLSTPVDRLPQIRKEYNNAEEIMEDIDLHFIHFKKFFIQLDGNYATLTKLKKSFPTKYIELDDFEDLLLKASQGKHNSLEMSKVATGMSSELDTKLEFFMANMKIYMAEDALKLLNFPKPTDTMREAYINTKKEITELKILHDRFETLSSSLDKLYKMFENDEINFRRFMEKKDKLRGLK